MNFSRRNFLKQIGSTAAGSIIATTCFAQEPDTAAKQTGDVDHYLKNLYAEKNQQFTFRPDYSGGYQSWQAAARPKR